MTSGVHDGREKRIRVTHQSLGRVEFRGETVIHDQNFVTFLQHLVAQSVHDTENRSTGAVLPHRPLEESVRPGINGCGGLIQQQDLGVAQDGTGEAKELTLADAVVGAVVGDDGVQLFRSRGDEFFHANELEGVPEGGIVVAAFEVQSSSDGTGEDERV